MNTNRNKSFVLFFLLISIVLTQAPDGFAGNPLRIGATISMSGKYSEPSEMIQNGYRLWARQVNERGGLLGRSVELIIYDDKSRKDHVGNLYEKLITKDRVDLVFSPYGTQLTLTASEVTERYGYVMLACAAAGEAIFNRGYSMVFGVYALADRYFIGFQDLMARHGFETLGIIYEKTSFNISIANGAQRWADRMGLVARFVEGFDNAERDLPILLARLKKIDVDGLIFSGYPPECYRFIRLMQQARYRPKALAFTIAPVHPDFFKKIGGFADGIFGPSQWEPDERIPFPGTKQFISDFKAFAGKMPSYHAGSAYSACQIMERAINHIKDIDHKRIRNFIHSLDTVTVIGRFKVDHKGRQVGHNPILIQWQKGKKEIVYPTKMKTATAQFGLHKE